MRRQEITQTQARKDSKAGRKKLKGSQEETQRQAAKERLKGRQLRKDSNAGSQGKI
jgi:hypothetical protein